MLGEKKNVMRENNNAVLITTSHHLPDDLVMSIFSYLPVRSLFRFKSLSKNISSLIHNSYFVSNHLTHYHTTIVDPNKRTPDVLYHFAMHSKFTRLTLYNETTGIPFGVYNFSGGHKKLSGVVGFSNGVVCLYGLVRLSGVYHMSFYFWNPLFNKFVKHECLESLLSSRCTGFGYDSHSNDFKLVHVSEENDQLLARVYRISGIGNNNTWRISSVPLPRRVSKLYTHDLASVYVNGALNWMSREDLYILSFDMKDEVFQEFALPPRMIELYYAHSLNLKLTEFNGMLCVLPFWIECCIPFCVWVMKDYGKVESWTLLWEITLRDDPRISEEGPLEVEGWKNEGEDAWVVDAYSGQVSLLNFGTLEFSDHQMFPKADTLIRGSYSESLALMDGEDGQA